MAYNTKIRLVRNSTNTFKITIKNNKKMKKFILAWITWTLIITMYIISESNNIVRHNENNETRLENIELRRQLDFHKNVIKVLEEEGKDVEQAERDVRGW